MDDKRSPCGINKSLLTPCRQVGLSRKRKSFASPLNLLNNSSDSIYSNISPISLHEDISLSNSSTPNSSSTLKADSNTNSSTPLGSKYRLGQLKRRSIKSSLITHKSCNETISVRSSDYEEKNRSDESKGGEIILNKKDSFDTLAPIARNVETKLKQTKQDNKRSSLIIPNKSLDIITEKTDTLRVQNDNTITLKDNVTSQNRTILPNVMNHHLKIDFKESSSDEIASVELNFETFTQDLRNEMLKKPKTLKRSLSTKKYSSYISEDEEDEPVNSNSLDIMKKCEVKLERLQDSEKEETKQPCPYVDENNELSLLRQTMSIDDDEDAFTSSPKNSKMKKLTIAKDINTIKPVIKKKKDEYEKLKQAQVYKRRHNIEELEVLTDKFQKGCVTALNDLLKQLQTHGVMDMNTLLHKLQVPDALIPYFPVNCHK